MRLDHLIRHVYYIFKESYVHSLLNTFNLFCIASIWEDPNHRASGRITHKGWKNLDRRENVQNRQLLENEGTGIKKPESRHFETSESPHANYQCDHLD